MKILFLGDIMGRPGRNAVRQLLPIIKDRHAPDLIIANIENAAHGKGVTVKIITELLDLGVDFFTGGNHVFDNTAAGEVFAKFPEKIIRPANFVDTLPGRGYRVIKISGVKVLIVNLNGQVFMEKQFDNGPIANPFYQADRILADDEAKSATVKLLDFHAEATSEKRAMGLYLDGRFSAVLGTHSHVATADSQVLPLGTGYQSDLGMIGVRPSIIGVTYDSAIKNFLRQEGETIKFPLQIAEGKSYEAGYVVLEIDEVTGKCQNIKGYLDFFNDETNTAN